MRLCRCGTACVRKRCAPCQRQHETAAAGAIVNAMYRMTVELLDPTPRTSWRRALYRYLAQRDGESCALCGELVDLSIPGGPRGSGKGPSVDHVQPRKMGGPDDPANLTLTHWACNHARHLDPHPSFSAA